jgi:hypothetical protein
MPILHCRNTSEKLKFFFQEMCSLDTGAWPTRRFVDGLIHERTVPKVQKAPISLWFEDRKLRQTFRSRKIRMEHDGQGYEWKRKEDDIFYLICNDYDPKKLQWVVPETPLYLVNQAFARANQHMPPWVYDTLTPKEAGTWREQNLVHRAEAGHAVVSDRNTNTVERKTIDLELTKKWICRLYP